MPRPEIRRRLSQEEMRSRILGAAAIEFARNGFDRTTLDEVAAAAGFTKGAVYSRFSSKDDLFFALLEEQIVGRIKAAGDALDHPSGDADEMHPAAAIGRQINDALVSEQDWQILFLEFWLRVVREPQIAERFRTHRRHLRQSIADFVEAEARRRNLTLLVSPSEMAIVALALSNGLSIEEIPDQGTVAGDLFGRILTLACAPAAPGRDPHEPRVVNPPPA
ncbi:TetR/AcrR family transcriptional regulator [Nocardia sp. NPDC057663]|uniref:TetR/AcrR family transcriptional regulator n=1 Tax=Nocardia sp. NPDC057663 TaxID=3346201 RepID=UPI0036711A56